MALALAVIAAATLAALPAEAQAGGQAAAARAEFTAGLEAAEESRWDVALQHFERSYELAPTAAALYNAATTLRALGRHREARNALQGLLDAHELEPDVRESAEAMRDEEEARLALLELVLSPDAEEVSVRVDGTQRVDTGERPLPVEVDAGERSLSVEEPGRQPFFWRGELAEGERRRVDVLLPTHGGDADGRGWYGSPWVWLVAGGVVAIAATIVVVVLATSDDPLQPRTDLVLRP